MPPRVFGPFLPHPVNRVIRRDAISPSPKIRARSKLAEVAISPQKRLLHHFLGVVLVSRHAVRQPKKLLAMPFDQHAESIAFARKRALDSDGIALSGRVLGCLAVLHAAGAFAHPNH